MPDNKKYYYLKLKEGFFDSDEMIVLESMPDGYLYSNILLKLYLRSLKYQGRLMFSDRIPFNSTMLAQVTRHSVGVVEKAMQILKELGLVEILDNGAIYMSDIQNFIGKSSTEADRIREYRSRIESEKKGGNPSRTSERKMLYKCTPEIDIEIDKDIDKEIDPPIIPPGGWVGVEEGPLLDALKAFEAMRKRNKRPMTDRAKELLLKRLRKLSDREDEWIAMLEQATLSGWQSVYPLKGDEKPNPERMDDLDEFF